RMSSLRSRLDGLIAYPETERRYLLRHEERRSTPPMIMVVTLVLSLTLAVLVLPGNAAADCSDRITLDATSSGDDYAASGRAEIRSLEAGEQQSFTVQVSVEVPDGTDLFVFANGQPANKITVVQGVGTLSLSTGDGAFPSGADVCTIGPVSVTDASGTTLLDGSF